MFAKPHIASFGTRAAAAAGLAALAVTVPAATAGAQTSSPLPSTLPPSMVNFTPPTVGTVCSVIGPVIIGGQMTSPGLNVCTPPLAGSIPPPQSLPGGSTGGSKGGSKG